MKKFLLSMFMLVCVSLMAMADSVTIDLNSKTGFDGGSSGYSVTVDGFNISYVKASSTTNCIAPKDDHIRVYKDANFIIAGTEGVIINKIILTGIAKNIKEMKVGDSSYSWSNNQLTWMGSASSVTFSATGGQSQITNIQIDYTSANDDRTKVLLSYSETSVTANLGEAFDAPILTVDPEEAKSVVVCSSENTSVADFVEGTLEIVGAGTTTITASIPSDNIQYYAQSASYQLTVVDPNAVETTLNPTFFNYAETAYNKVSTVVDDVTGVKYSAIYSGTKTTMSFNTNNKNGGKSSQIVVSGVSDKYLIKSITIMASSSDALSKFDVYKSDTEYAVPTVDTSNKPNTSGTKVDATVAGTYEINAKAFMMVPNVNGSFTISGVKVVYAKIPEGALESELSFSKESEQVIDGEEYTSPKLNNPKGIKIVSTTTDEEVAMFDEQSGEVVLMGKLGSATITVSPSEENDKQYIGEASYTVTVVKNYNSLSLLLELENQATAYVNCPLTVVAIQGSYCFVVDAANGRGLIYKSGLQYTPGDIIPVGWDAKMNIYNGLHELVPTSNMPEATEKGEYLIETYDAEYLEVAMENEVLRLENVVFEDATPSSSTAFTGLCEDVAIKFYNSAKIASVPAGLYHVTLAASVFNENIQYIPLEYAAVPSTPVVMIGDEAYENDDEVISLDGKESVIIVLNHDDGDNHTVYHKFTEDVPVAVNALDPEDDGFVAYAEAITVTKAGKLELYAKHNTTGAKSATRTLTFSGTVTTGIRAVDIECAAEATEWYDLQGRRVAAPAKGVYIRRQAGNVSKVAM